MLGSKREISNASNLDYGWTTNSTTKPPMEWTWKKEKKEQTALPTRAGNPFAVHC